MTATANPSGSATSATAPGPVCLRTEVFDQRCKELGLITENAKAERLGVDRVTLHRFRKGEIGPRLDVAMRFAERLNLTIEQLWSRA